MPIARASIASHRTAGVGATQNIKWSSEEQRRIFLHGTTPLMASGGWGSGKTMGAAFKATYLSAMYPNNRGVVARRRWEELKKTTMATFFKIIPLEAYSSGGRRSDAEKILKFNNGSEILWMHMDDPDIETVINGLEINWFFLDQAEEIQERIFDKLLGRLGRWDAASVPQHIIDDFERKFGAPWPYRSQVDGRPMVPTYAIAACNPSDELHWIYRRFHPDSDEHYAKTQVDEYGVPVSFKEMGYTFIDMPSTINKFLPKQNLTRMLNADAATKRRFVEGKWGNPEGTIHHIHPDSLIRGNVDTLEWLVNSCRLFRVLDHGESSPTCCTWWAVDRNGNVICYREYYMPNKLISDHRKAITSLTGRDEKFEDNLADPSIFFQGGQRAGEKWSVAEEYADVAMLSPTTALVWSKAQNDELSIRNRINEYLRYDEGHINPFTGTRGSPRLFFLTQNDDYPNGAKHTIRETRAQRRLQVGSDLGKPVFSDERDEDIVDHGYDNVRYMIGSRPSVAAQLVIPGEANSFKAVNDKRIKFAKKGGYSILSQIARNETAAQGFKRRR